VSPTRLLVLGVVRQHGTAHGYQVRRTLLESRADAWAHVNPGSIYQSLRTLTKIGLLEPVVTETAAGPERTVYRITPDGESEFLHMVRTGITDPDPSGLALNASFAFLHVLSRDELPVLLEHRRRALRARLAGLPGGPDGKPPQVAELERLYTAQIQADIDWSVELSERIRGGAYVFADDGAEPRTA
jgi:DNA-binding PadR family transcriptional regulator